MGLYTEKTLDSKRYTNPQGHSSVAYNGQDKSHLNVHQQMNA